MRPPDAVTVVIEKKPQEKDKTKTGDMTVTVTAGPTPLEDSGGEGRQPLPAEVKKIVPTATVTRRPPSPSPSPLKGGVDDVIILPHNGKWEYNYDPPWPYRFKAIRPESVPDNDRTMTNHASYKDGKAAALEFLMSILGVEIFLLCLRCSVSVNVFLLLCFTYGYLFRGRLRQLKRNWQAVKRFSGGVYRALVAFGDPIDDDPRNPPVSSPRDCESQIFLTRNRDQLFDPG